MKKEEFYKDNLLKELRSNQDFRSRSHSPKLYFGCHTCKLKNNEVKNVKSTSDFQYLSNKNKVNKIRKNHQEKKKEREPFSKSKIKLTDLCDDDKKRLVMLIEELSKLEEKNHKLKEMLDRMQKTKQEQQAYIMNQENLHIQEKNYYVNEINMYKNKIDTFEKEIEIKTVQWQNQEKLMDTEMSCLVKALQEAFQEKCELNEEMNHLKFCLKQALEAFQKLGVEVSELQRQESCRKKIKSVFCQTDTKNENFKSCNEDSEDEDFVSASNLNNSLNSKSGLHIINDKLENMYKMIKMQGESLVNLNPQKYDIDLSILLKNEESSKELSSKEENINGSPDIRDEGALKEESDQDIDDNGYKFLKPFDECSKTSIQAQRILKKMGKPFNLIVNRCTKNLTENNPKKFKIQANFGDINQLTTNILQQKIVQQNNLYNSSDQELSEDRLLEELFYTDKSLNVGLQAILELNNENKEKI